MNLKAWKQSYNLGVFNCNVDEGNEMHDGCCSTWQLALPDHMMRLFYRIMIHVHRYKCRPEVKKMS